MSDIGKDFFERLEGNPRPVVVDFWASWCGPCKMIVPAIKRLGQEYDGQVDVWKVNADEQPDILRKLRIYGIPTIIAYNAAGQEVTRKTGAASQGQLQDLFDAALLGEKPAGPSLTFIERLLRAALGVAFLILAYSGGFSGIYLGFAVLSGVAFFSAVYDRCPLWQTIAPRIKALFTNSPDSEESGP